MFGMEDTNEEKIRCKPQSPVSFLLDSRNSPIKYQIYFLFVVSFLFLPGSHKSPIKSLQQEAFGLVGLKSL